MWIRVDRLEKHLLEMITELKEEIDVDRVIGNNSSVAPTHATRPDVDSMQQIGHLSLPTSFPQLRTCTRLTRLPSWLRTVEGSTGSSSFSITRVSRFTTRLCELWKYSSLTMTRWMGDRPRTIKEDKVKENRQMSPNI